MTTHPLQDESLATIEANLARSRERLSPAEKRRELLKDLLQICLEFDRVYREIELDISSRIDSAFGRATDRPHRALSESDRSPYVALSDDVGTLDSVIVDLISRVVRIAIEEADALAPWTPDAMADWPSLEGEDRQRLAARIFTRAGISERVMPLDERYPDVGEGETR